LKRSELKSVIKECLVELLAEGLGTNTGGIRLSETKKNENKKKVMLLEVKRLAAHRQKFETKVSDTVSGITDDPVMRDILSHTAQTTLQEQISNNPQASGDNTLQDNNAPGIAGINLDSIFASPSKNWAEMAFTDNKTSQE